MSDTNIFSSIPFQVILSSAAISALITSIVNYRMVYKTNKNLLEIEIMKQESEITTFRYTRIFNALEEISALPIIDHTYLKLNGQTLIQDEKLFQNVVEQKTTRYVSVTKIFERVRPLMDESFLPTAILIIEEANHQSDLLTEAIYTNKPLPENLDVVTLSQTRENAEIEIIQSLNKQISSLTSATSILRES